MEKVLENLVKNEIKNFNENKYKNNFYDDTDLGKINVKVFGIGGAGCNVIECMAKSYNWNNAVSLYALDTDVRTLRRICESGLNANCHLLGKDICRGNGTGGDVELAKQVASNDIEQFKKFIHGSDLIFFISGLGKGTGSAITPVFSSIAKEAGICTVDVITLPSVQAEGHDVYEKSLASYQEIIDSCNSFYTISNDKLINAYIEDEKMTYENLLNKANMQVINLIKVISDILSNPLYTTIAASDILAFFRKTKIFALLSTEIRDSEYSFQTISEKINAIVAKDCSIVPISNSHSALLNILTTPKTSKNLIVNLKSILASYPNNNNISLKYSCLERPNSDVIKIDILLASKLTKEELLSNYDQLETSNNNSASHSGFVSQIPMKGESNDFGIFSAPAKKDKSSVLPTSEGIKVTQFLDTKGLAHSNSNFQTKQQLSDRECTDILESVYLKAKK